MSLRSVTPGADVATAGTDRQPNQGHPPAMAHPLEAQTALTREIKAARREIAAASTALDGLERSLELLLQALEAKDHLGDLSTQVGDLGAGTQRLSA